MDKFYIKLLLRHKEETGEKLTLPFHATSEAMIEHLSRDNKIGVIVKDEATTILKNARKQYGADYYEMMSKLYDGSYYERRTRKAGLEIVPSDTYVNMIAATTPYIYKVLEEEFFTQGLGNRILYVLWNGETEDSEGIFDVDIKNYDSKDADILNKLRTLREKCENVRTTIPLKESESTLTKWRDKISRIVEKFYNEGKLIEQSYYGRMWEMLVKLAALHSIARWYNNPKANVAFVIEEKDTQWAIDKTIKYIKNFHRLLEEWRGATIKTDAKLESSEKLHETIIATIRENGGRITKRELLAKRNMTKNKISAHIETLVEMEKITLVSIPWGSHFKTEIFLDPDEAEKYMTEMKQKYPNKLVFIPTSEMIRKGQW
ncbi:hypothetical protein DRP05_07720 [Archaeoglobales archaeon]|nr:MAG: hypothetical protein DRP05_07720 [Archaeoglobales archaeon]